MEGPRNRTTVAVAKINDDPGGIIGSNSDCRSSFYWAVLIPGNSGVRFRCPSSITIIFMSSWPPLLHYSCWCTVQPPFSSKKNTVGKQIGDSWRGTNEVFAWRKKNSASVVSCRYGPLDRCDLRDFFDENENSPHPKRINQAPSDLNRFPTNRSTYSTYFNWPAIVGWIYSEQMLYPAVPLVFSSRSLSMATCQVDFEWTATQWCEVGILIHGAISLWPAQYPSIFLYWPKKKLKQRVTFILVIGKKKRATNSPFLSTKHNEEGVVIRVVHVYFLLLDIFSIIESYR